MAINKNAFTRYQVIDRCLRNPGRKYYWEDLLDECNEALADAGYGGIGKSQLYADLRFMESSAGWSIPLIRIKDGHRKYLRYEDINFSISNQPINELEAEQLKSAMAVLKRFKGLPQFKWINEMLPKLDQAFHIKGDTEGIISFDKIEFLKGLDFIDPLFNAILYRRSVNIHYQSFKNPEPVTMDFSPYHLKEYNNRWFVYGKDFEYPNIINLALDRIVDITDSDSAYKTSDIDFEEHFEDIIGVSFSPEQEPEKILLRIDRSLWPYIDTKPLHGSQKVKAREDEYVEISLELIPNYELESQIFHFGEKVEVLKPVEFREKIKKRARALFEKYN